ncbi:type I-G CRISPR-associated protein Cas8g1/Csx17 [Almyronema epifaneia]|uniref:Type I-U CRISPR-associated protein Csx17 n=1 Tax=Almyronema epifaneia S1 TaxID=2991925 RepID=A0ABW6IJJ5_9CYAN
MPSFPELKGCTPEPLSNYLKALGILRLVVEQNADPKAKSYWYGNYFCLQTALSKDELTQFFLSQYRPTPLVAPWNGSTGFYPKDKAQKKLLAAFQSAEPQRFGIYGKTIAIAQKQVEDLKLEAQPKERSDKQRLLTRLRNNLPDEAVKWLDTCALITSEGISFPPLMGTGGNDGNFEFSRTFMQQLQVVMDLKTGEPTELAEPLLRAAIFDAVVPGLAFSGKIGQFNPIAAGGANASPGYDADSRVNPWDFILMLEGTLLFISGATRRYEHTAAAEMAYPFTVRSATVGYGSAAEADKSRAELWTPLWSSPTGLKELQSLFSEGRAKVGTRTATDGVDFARAISSFGVRIGLDEFVRYSFQERNGLSYFAIPIGRFQPHQNHRSSLLNEIDSWLLRLKGEAQKDTALASLRRSHRQLQTAILKLAQQSTGLLEVLIALGQVEATLDLSLRTKEQKYPTPIPRLSKAWVSACNDNSPEFRLALALAGQNLRERLVWVRFNERNYPQWQKSDDGKTIWQHGTLIKNLINWLKRQEIEWLQQQKRDSPAPDSEETRKQQMGFPIAPLGDVALWIAGAVDEERIAAIARGLSLVDLNSFETEYSAPSAAYPVPAAYALVKLAHYRELTKARLSRAVHKIFLVPKGQSPSITLSDQPLPHTPGLLTHLAAGNSLRATELAARRLHASGYAPAVRTGLFEPGDRPQRIAAALAFPLADWDMARLLKQVCQLNAQPDDKEHNGLLSAEGSNETSD